MTYPRVNLLTQNERRYQGAVSRKFIFICAVAAPILLIAILSSIKLIQYSGVKSSLAASRSLWGDTEPRLKLFREENRGLVNNRQALELFEGWEKSQSSLVRLLDEIQNTVPSQIQFTRLSVRSAPTPAFYSSADAMPLTFSLEIEGQAQGKQAENYVIGMRKDLLACEQIGSTFDSIKLVSMRKRSSSKGESLRDFKLEGVTASEEGK